jgi:hypothetical protein
MAPLRHYAIEIPIFEPPKWNVQNGLITYFKDFITYLGLSWQDLTVRNEKDHFHDFLLLFPKRPPYGGPLVPPKRGSWRGMDSNGVKWRH